MSREGPRVLFCAFAEVPGPTAAGVRTAQMMRAFGGGFDVDGLCLKGPEAAHIERLGAVRVMRVPVENKPFLERLAVFQRALGRQLAGDRYDIVWCADLFSAGMVAPYQEAQGFTLLVDVGDVPSESFARRYDVDAGDKKRRVEWSQGEQGALRKAAWVLAPSRRAAKSLHGRVDPSKVRVLPRAVDREHFAPPSVEVALDGKRTVLVVGGREGGALLTPSVKILAALAGRCASEDVRLAFAGAPPAGDDRARVALEEARLDARVELVDTEGPEAMAAALSEAHVVVVPSLAEAGVDPLAVPHRALEAMAARRATVLTGPPEAFSDMLVPGEDALVIPAGEPAAVAAAVGKLLDGPALREAVAQSGARRVEQEADLATRLQQVRALFAELLGSALTAPPEATSPSDAKGSSDGSSSVFTDEAYSAVRPPPRPSPPPRPQAPPAPTPPVEASPPELAPVPLAEASPPSESLKSPESQVPPEPPEPSADDKTLIAPPPEGLEDALATPSADWYGDTRIEPEGAFETPTPLEERGKGTLRTPLSPEMPTSTAAPPGSRSLAAELSSLPDGDPWSYDTIADARPVFTSEDGAGKTPPPARTVAVEVPGGSFLVDPEHVEDRTVDEMQLPRDLSSSPSSSES